MGVCMYVCVCSQVSRSRATLSCDSSYLLLMKHYFFRRVVLAVIVDRYMFLHITH